MQVPKAFDQVLDLVRMTFQLEKEVKEQARELPKGPSGSAARQQSKQKSAGPPIIIIPSAVASLLTRVNIKKFLEEGEYVEGSTSTALSKDAILIERPATKFSIEGNPTSYLVVDNVQIMSKDDWERVVAVFTFGATWQFQNYAWKNPTDLFANTCGFYFHHKGVAPHPNIQKWNVRSLVLPHEKVHSHQAHTTWLEFWNHLERWVSVRRSGFFGR